MLNYRRLQLKGQKYCSLDFSYGGYRNYEALAYHNESLYFCSSRDNINTFRLGRIDLKSETITGVSTVFGYSEEDRISISFSPPTGLLFVSPIPGLSDCSVFSKFDGSCGVADMALPFISGVCDTSFLNRQVAFCDLPKVGPIDLLDIPDDGSFRSIKSFDVPEVPRHTLSPSAIVFDDERKRLIVVTTRRESSQARLDFFSLDCRYEHLKSMTLTIAPAFPKRKSIYCGLRANRSRPDYLLYGISTYNNTFFSFDSRKEQDHLDLLPYVHALDDINGVPEFKGAVFSSNYPDSFAFDGDKKRFLCGVIFGETEVDKQLSEDIYIASVEAPPRLNQLTALIIGGTKAPVVVAQPLHESCLLDNNNNTQLEVKEDNTTTTTTTKKRKQQQQPTVQEVRKMLKFPTQVYYSLFNNVLFDQHLMSIIKEFLPQ